MKPKERYIVLTVAAVSARKVQMPWTRGTRRAQMIARRAQVGIEARKSS